jgi:hypothetical protein
MMVVSTTCGKLRPERVAGVARSTQKRPRYERRERDTPEVNKLISTIGYNG